MLLSEWAQAAPSSGCMNQAVLEALAPVLADMGAGEDPECWVAWGDDPEYKYSVLAPTAAGLVAVAVRLNPGGEGGPRATAKLVRWSKIQIGEFSIEAADGHRVVAVQIEGLVLKGTDQIASDICEFVRTLLAGADGRAFAAAGPVVVQAVPVAGPAAAPRPAARVASAAAEAQLAEAPPAEPAPAPKSGRKGAKPKPQPQAAEPEPDFVAPHPIPVSDERVPVAPPANPPTPGQPPAPPVPPARIVIPGQSLPGQPPASPYGPGNRPGLPPVREPGSVWEVPAADPAARDQKKPRTWRP